MTGDNPYLRRQARHALGKAGRASEKRLARELKARARPASGAMTGAKGDIDLGTVLMEAKSTTSKSMSLQLEWLAKIANEARSEDKTPALAISFVRPDGTTVMDGSWVCVPRYVWEEKLL